MANLLSNQTDITIFVNKGLVPMTQNYLSDVWMDKKDGDYKLSPEFE